MILLNPVPWGIYDPNALLVVRKVKFRPIYIRDANNAQVLYVGNGEPALDVARRICEAVNREELK